MDAFSDPLTHTVVGMTSAQVGKTSIIENVLGFYVDQDPSPILVLQPTLEMAEAFSKDRLAPMARDTPTLKGKIRDAKSRDSGNTLLHKQYPGGQITMAGANSPASLASRPVRVVLADEVDRYPASAGTEGDPLALGFKRTIAFWNRKRGVFSTPTIKGLSRIERAYEGSDQRRYFVPCPHCGAMHALEWKHVHWDEHATRAWMSCETCGAEIAEGEKTEMLLRGEWRAQEPFRGIAGFHLNELYSPWRKWLDVVHDFLAAKGKPETLKTWVNTSLGETWNDDEGSEASDPEVLKTRREPYTVAPDGVLVVLLTIDTQDDRLEYEFTGWGVGEECWGLEVGVLEGNPGRDELWQRAEDLLGRQFRRADGAVLTVERAGIDTGGHYTKQAYAFVKRSGGRCLALKGDGGQGKVLIRRGGLVKDYAVRLWMVGVDAGKDLLMFSRLRITQPGEGYCHFPAAYPDTYFAQLCSERAVTRYSRGQPYRQWMLPSGRRNEALDLRVYALALIALVRPAWEALAERLKGTAVPAKPEPKPAGKWVQPRTGWMRR